MPGSVIETTTGVVAAGHEIAQAHRAQRWTGRRQRHPICIARGSGQAGERLEAVLALARSGQRAGSTLDELGIAVAGGLLGPDLPGSDVLAEADDRSPGDRVRRRIGCGGAGLNPC